MVQFPYWQMDVFPRRRGGGNPLGVVLDARGWSDAAMQAFATWTNLVETTFVLPPSAAQADYRVRIFTPRKEIPFAGHPSLGTAQALVDSGRLPRDRPLLWQECGAGVLPIRSEEAGTRLLVQAPSARRAAVDPVLQERLSRLIGDATLGATGLQCIEGGRRWWLAELRDEAAVRAFVADHAAIAALARDSDTLGLCVFARTGAVPELRVRAFPAGVGIVEDPASGAANGLIAAWLRMAEPQGPLANGYRVSQGREMGHDALIEIEIDADGAVWVGGRSNAIIRGELEWEAETSGQ
jgi:PhzF family phenazine biosynthesis protein